MSTEFYLVAVVLVTIIAAARITRLAVYDDFPPVKWLRDKYAEATDPSQWQLLAICGYCFSYWGTWLVFGSGLLCHVYGHPPDDLASRVWWIVTASLALSYLAAWFVANDGDKTQGRG